MASPGVLRLLSELADGSIEEFTPVIDDEGQVSYPDVEEHLDASDGSPFEVLESLARQGVLYREFRDKAYICPDCSAEGMSYTTICPDCGSPNTVEMELLEHIECGGVAPRENFQTEDGEYVCPDCGLSIHPEHTELLSQHVCQTCGERADVPADSLRCRDCVTICDPAEATEWVLYSYGFERDGEHWLETQLSARQSMVEMLNGRGFTVDVDTTVTDESGEEYPVHIYGEDDLLGDRVVADVHERPNVTDVENLRSAAATAGGRCLLVSTSGTVSEQAGEIATTDDIGLLSLQQDGSLCRDYETTPNENQQSVFDRITSGVRQQFNQ
jgi:DNA-directed RNA polymerase subunit RPC12/RpoP